jgi:imidazolonepropionase-like amidohydrolase
MAQYAFALVLLASLVAAACGSTTPASPQQSTAVVFEGARLILGDERAPIDNGAFIVDNGLFTYVGPAGTVQVPEGTTRVNLAGKTVMPALIDAHGHMGYRRGASFRVENYTRENLIDHLQRQAYHGVAAFMSMGTERDLGMALRDELRANPQPNMALFLTAGRGVAMPNGGPNPPLRESPYPVDTEAEIRDAVRAEAAKKIDGYIKIWVDDREGTVKKLTPDLYASAIDEAHKLGLKAATHTQDREDVKGILKAGVDGFVHPPWRLGQEVDDELVTLFKERPQVWMLLTLWGTRNQIFGPRPAWIDDPLLRETFNEEDIRLLENPKIPADAAAQWKAGVVPRGLAKLKAAGVRFGVGTDAGATNGAQYFGYAAHMEMASMVEAGMTPAEVITIATRNSAEILGLNQLGTVATGKSADFIVLDANPLENIHNSRKISAVYLRGQAVDRAGLRAKWQGQRSTTE